jgi:hypothetical protein
MWLLPTVTLQIAHGAEMPFNFAPDLLFTDERYRSLRDRDAYEVDLGIEVSHYMYLPNIVDTQEANYQLPFTVLSIFSARSTVQAKTSTPLIILAYREDGADGMTCETPRPLVPAPCV